MKGCSVYDVVGLSHVQIPFKGEERCGRNKEPRIEMISRRQGLNLLLYNIKQALIDFEYRVVFDYFN